MSNEIAGSVSAGSPNEIGPAVSGEPNKSGDFETMYRNLETKFGEQGRQLGDLKAALDKYTLLDPFLDKLEENPELVKAIMNDKIDDSLVKSILEGKITQQQAEVVTEANKNVQERLGEAITKASPQELSKLVAEEIAKLETNLRESLKKEFTKKEEEEEWKEKSNDFMRSKTDFVEYADQIAELSKETGIIDLENLYNAVKVKVLSEKQAKQDELAAAEASKELASNASGGGNSYVSGVEARKLADILISGTSNPNLF